MSKVTQMFLIYFRLNSTNNNGLNISLGGRFLQQRNNFLGRKRKERGREGDLSGEETRRELRPWSCARTRRSGGETLPVCSSLTTRRLPRGSRRVVLPASRFRPPFVTVTFASTLALATGVRATCEVITREKDVKRIRQARKGGLPHEILGQMARRGLSPFVIPDTKMSRGRRRLLDHSDDYTRFSK